MPPFAFSSNPRQQTPNAMNQDSGEPPPPKPPTTAPDSGDPSIIIPQIPVTPAPEQVNLNCPRCNSTNTKFCYYYDNYNLSQARHFCKSCRRSWIKVTSDSVERRYLNPPPVPAVSTPEQEDNHKCRPCKPLKSPATVAMSPVDRHKRPIPAAPKPDPENLPCPRCNSANTKFCYYNNYNLSQPRYFCRVCRRYWTKGGILRDIPEGSGIARRYGRRARMRADPAPMASDYQPPLIIGDYEPPEEASSEGDRKIEVQESSGEPFLNGWSLGSREQGSEFSISAGFEEMGFGRPVWQQ